MSFSSSAAICCGTFERREVARVVDHGQGRAGDAAMQRLRHRDRRRIVLVADRDPRRHAQLRQRRRHVAGAEHAAGLRIGLARCSRRNTATLSSSTSLRLARKASVNQRVVWNSSSASRPLVSAVRGALLPLVGGVVPGGGVEQAEPGGALRVGGGEGERDAPAHRGAGDDGGAPADVIEELGEVVGEVLDPIGAVRLVGAAMAAAVIDQHRGLVGQRRRHRVPERVVHAERMDEHDRRRILHAVRGFRRRAPRRRGAWSWPSSFHATLSGRRGIRPEGSYIHAS